MLVLTAILVTAMGAWLSQSVFFAAVAKLPPKLQEPLTNRFAVDPYIWTEPAFRPLRRRYAIGQALLILAFALWAMVAIPHRIDIAAGFGFVAGVGAIFLGYRILRNGP
jgi:hypothetical protein